MWLWWLEAAMRSVTYCERQPRKRRYVGTHMGAARHETGELRDGASARSARGWQRLS